ncbi:hypothetical protein H0Z60_11190 [Ectothiorhodospiraceae bacterium WFHF3C12]|nr:hypothetical protein [Ectothiorhodospiraceae bacterium WFHF3C12]
MAVEEPETSFEEAAREAVELGNRIADDEPESHPWDIGDGLLAGAIQYWLYARQPCDDPACEDCASMRTAELRLAELLKQVEELARTSEYFHTPNDFGAGRA